MTKTFVYKVCTKCKVKKLCSEFYRAKKGKLGRESQCKTCQKEDRRIFYVKNRKSINATIRKNKHIYRKIKQRYLKSHPWMKTLNGILSRCTSKAQPYYKKGIKNFLTAKEIRYLWFRDKAYLLKQPSIDRKNSKGHYVLENCRYIELKENQSRKIKQGGGEQ